jgi:hypothetical protein
LVGVGVIIGIVFAAGDDLFTDVIADVSVFGCWLYAYTRLYPKAANWDDAKM